jgi:hypothetical protein
MQQHLYRKASFFRPFSNQPMMRRQLGYKRVLFSGTRYDMGAYRTGAADGFNFHYYG